MLLYLILRYDEVVYENLVRELKFKCTKEKDLSYEAEVVQRKVYKIMGCRVSSVENLR